MNSSPSLGSSSRATGPGPERVPDRCQRAVSAPRLSLGLALVAGLGLAGSIWAQDATPPAPLSWPDAVYQVRLQARYEPETREIAGFEHLVWRNTSSVPIHELRFHHYLNAFANNRTTFMAGSRGQLRGTRFDGKRWGFVEVSSLRLADGTDLKAVERFVAPDDGNEEDRTVAVYPLPEPLAPGAAIEIDLDFTSRLPAIFARTGAEGDFVMAGQWFPKIGVFEDAGVRGRPQPGWNCHQFHPTSEFYADFGDYDVELDLPERYRGHIGATGRMVEESAADGRVKVRYVQAGVHDFAWTGDPRFLVFEERFDPAVDVPEDLRRELVELLGLSPEEAHLQPVELHLLLQPQHAPQARAHLDSVKLGLAVLGLRLGAYPYETLTLVDPAFGGDGARGMEYPTLITVGTSALMNLPVFRRLPAAEITAVHELAHQYFQGMVASNEFEESWLDEGITSYYETLISREWMPVRIAGVQLPLDMARRGAVARGDYAAPIATPAWRFPSFRQYAAASYGRPAVTLEHLEGLLGPKVFHRAMRTFFRTYRFRHPDTADFEAVLSRAAGRELDWFFRQAFHSSAQLDYAVRTVSSRRWPEAKGVFWVDGERVVLPGEAEDPTVSSGLELFESTVEVVREGEFRHPLTIEVSFEDGARQRLAWNGEARWWRRTFLRASPVVAATVDPDGVMALDVDELNNGRTAKPDHRPVAKLSAFFLFWAQNLFQALALLA